MGKIVNYTKNKLGFFGAIVTAALIGGLASATVLAAIPDSSGQINACYNNKNKTLRVTDPAGNCGSAYTALSWDQHGATVIGNRLEVANGSSGQTLLSVPGFGTFTVMSCDDSQGIAGYEFTNTSGTQVDVGVNFNDGNNQTSPLAAGDEWTHSTDPSVDGTRPGNTSIILGQGTGSSSKVASLQIFSSNDFDGVHTGCRFDAQATLN